MQQFFFPYQANAQNWNSLLNYLDEKDKKTVEKAVSSLKEAGELTQLANKYYSNALELQSNFDLEEETLQKKLSKEESRAISAQIKADKIYSESNKSVIEVCRNVLQNAGQKDEKAAAFEKNANDLMDQAVQKRNEANNTRNIYEKATLMNDASGLETGAIENMISAIADMNGDVLPGDQQEISEQVEETIQERLLVLTRDTMGVSKINTSEGNENITLDQQLLNKYNKYISDPTIPDPLLINRTGISVMDSFDISGIRSYYQNYREGEVLFKTAEESSSNKIATAGDNLVANIAVLPGNTIMQQSSDTGQVVKTAPESNTQKKLAQNGNSDFVNTENIITNKPVQTKKTSVNTTVREEFDLSYVQQNSEVRFLVQLAASRVPLTKVQLWAIYPGNLTIEIIKEKNWFIYRITGFRLFSEANRVALESGVESAYVLSTLQGKEIKLTEARQMTKVLEKESDKRRKASSKEQIDFYIQVAASRTQLAGQDRDDIFKSYPTCREVVENGWFKYQFFTGTSYSDAASQKASLPEKVFVVAYKGGTRIKLNK
jgi:hypothetical protein